MYFNKIPVNKKDKTLYKERQYWNLDELEKLEQSIRNKILKNGGNDILKNHLVGVLLDKIQLDFQKYSELLLEAKQLLFELKESQPNHLRVYSNLVRFGKIINDFDFVETYSRKIIQIDPKNNKAKIQLAKALIEQYKLSTQEQINDADQKEKIGEAVTLAQEVLNNDEKNFYATGILIEIAKLRNDTLLGEQLIREQIKFEEESLQQKINEQNDTKVGKNLNYEIVRIKGEVKLLKIRLSSILITQCFSQKRNGGYINKNDARILESKQYLLDILEKEKDNIYVIDSLLSIARLQCDIKQSKELLELKLKINPSDINSRENLAIVEQKISHQFNQEERKNINNMPEFTEESFAIDYSDKGDSVVEEYRRKLFEAITAGNKHMLIEILTKMKQIPELKKAANIMINLANSNNSRNKIALRAKIEELVI